MDQNCLENYVILQKCAIAFRGNSIYNDLRLGRKCKDSKIDDWKLATAMHNLICGHKLHIEENDVNDCISKDKICDIVFYINEKLDVNDCNC